MKKTLPMKASGIAMAIAAAGMLTACQQGESQSSSGSAAAGAELVHCYGVNVCGGHNDCKSAENACKGKASCKGHGFVKMSGAACDHVGGSLKDDWRGAASSAGNIHCVGVNKCGGHNDCKSAENACKGQAKCKGHGFVSMSAKACGDIGGKEG